MCGVCFALIACGLTTSTHHPLILIDPPQIARLQKKEAASSSTSTTEAELRAEIEALRKEGEQVPLEVRSCVRGCGGLWCVVVGVVCWVKEEDGGGGGKQFSPIPPPPHTHKMRRHQSSRHPTSTTDFKSHNATPFIHRPPPPHTHTHLIHTGHQVARGGRECAGPAGRPGRREGPRYVHVCVYRVMCMVMGMGVGVEVRVCVGGAYACMGEEVRVYI
jgi:hypothetical protein